VVQSARRGPSLGLAAVLVVVLGAALAACGGGDRLSSAAYVRRANTECANLEQASEDLARAQTAGATGEQVREYLNRAANGLADLAEGLEALAPPAAIEDDAAALGSALADYGDGLRTLASEVGPNQTFTDTLNAHQAIVRKLNALAERATELVSTLGIDGCQLAA
jgi:uncharacterized phage infection (PIP) family protein YhgE